MPGRKRKSLRLQAVKDEIDANKSYAPNVKAETDDDGEVKPNILTVKAETGDDGEVKPNISTIKAETGDDGEVKPSISTGEGKHLSGHKTEHAQSRHLRRRHGGKYGRDSRYAYIMSIAQQMKSSPADAVPGVGERLFHNAFKCLIDAIVSAQTEVGTEERSIEVGFDCDGFDSLMPFEGREYYLEKILTLLLCMARMRVYNPPSDNEVIYYREIKKHIRCMIAYHEAKGNTKDVQFAEQNDPASYRSMSCSQTISAVEELIELSGTLAEMSPHIWDLNHKNGSAPDVAVHVRFNFKSPPEPNWSTEKVNAFYYNKLILVLHDLKCSGLASLSPDSSEKKALEALLDYVASSSKHVKLVDVSTNAFKHTSLTHQKRKRETYELMFLADINDTNGLFDGRLFEYVHELRLSCLSFMLKLMEKVGTVVYPKKLRRRFTKDAADIINLWVNKQKVHPEKSPDYIEGIDRCIVLARFAAALIKGISSSLQDAFANLTDMVRREQHWSDFAPEALHVLSLLDCGAFRKAGDRMEIPLHAVSICDVTNTQDNRVISLENNSDNLKVLSTILHIMKDIGPLDAFVAPSPREKALLEQILENVSLCIDGFLSTKAYQKEAELAVAPEATARKNMLGIRQNGLFRGVPGVYDVYGGKYLVESLFDDFEQVQEDVDLMIPWLQEYKVLMQNA